MNMKYFLDDYKKYNLRHGLIKTWGTAVEKAIRGAIIRSRIRRDFSFDNS